MAVDLSNCMSMHCESKPVHYYVSDYTEARVEAYCENHELKPFEMSLFPRLQKISIEEVEIFLIIYA